MYPFKLKQISKHDIHTCPNIHLGMTYPTIHLASHASYMLGSKILGTNVLELQFVLCWQTMIKT